MKIYFQTCFAPVIIICIIIFTIIIQIFGSNQLKRTHVILEDGPSQICYGMGGMGWGVWEGGGGRGDAHHALIMDLI